METIKEINCEGLTLAEWLGAAIGDKRYESMLHESCVVNAARDAWKRGEDPTEYRNDHSSLESWWNSDHILKIRGLVKDR